MRRKPSLDKRQAVSLQFRHAAESLADAYLALMELWRCEERPRKARPKRRERK